MLRFILSCIASLSGDKVANIRLAVVFLLPRIITVMQLNKSSFDPLENVLAKLRKDFDSEIRYQVELLDSTSLDVSALKITINLSFLQYCHYFGSLGLMKYIMISNFILFS